MYHIGMNNANKMVKIDSVLVVDTIHNFDTIYIAKIKNIKETPAPSMKKEVVEGTTKNVVNDTIGVVEKVNKFINLPFSVENLKDCIEYYEIDCERWVYSQAYLETGNFTSKLFKQKNNLFGLYNSSKKTYFTFTHWSLSVKAYKDMIQREGRYDRGKYDDSNYHLYLKRIGYAEDPNYIIKLRRILDRG